MTQDMIDLIRKEYLITKATTQDRSPYAFGMSVNLELYCCNRREVPLDEVQASVDNHVMHLMKQIDACNEALKLATMYRLAVEDLKGDNV